jgi:hypothetical protein
MKIHPQLSSFIGMNKGIVTSDIIKHKRTSAEDIERMWRRRFTSEFEEDGAVVDSEEVNWVELLAEGLKKAKEVTIQSIKGKRTFALLESYEKDSNSIAASITGQQAEGSTKKVYN